MRKPLDSVEQAWLFRLSLKEKPVPGLGVYYSAVTSEGEQDSLQGCILTNDKEHFASKHRVPVENAEFVNVENAEFLIAFEATADLAMTGYKHPDGTDDVGEHKKLFVVMLADWKEGDAVAPRYGAMQRVGFLSLEEARSFAASQAELVEGLSAEAALDRVKNAQRGVWSVIEVNARVYPLSEIREKDIPWGYCNVAVFKNSLQAREYQREGLQSEKFIYSADYWISSLLELEEWSIDQLENEKISGLIFKDVPRKPGAKGYYEAVIGKGADVKLIKNSSDSA